MPTSECEECARLEAEEAQAWRSLQDQRHINSQWHVWKSAARREEQRLTEAHNLAGARRRMHKAVAHPQDGPTSSNAADFIIIIRNGRTRP